MQAKVMIIGAGAVGRLIARGLAQGGVEEIVLAGLCQGEGPAIAAMITTCSSGLARFVELDATRQADVERLLRAERPDVLVQAATLIAPWPSLGRRDPLALALSRAGLGLHLPAQLPVLIAVMSAAKAIDYSGPIANLSYPDVANVVLARLDLAPSIGLGNVSNQLLKVRGVLKARAGRAEELPLVRMVAHHVHVTGVMGCEPPRDESLRPRVYLGEEGAREDELAYAGTPISRPFVPAGLTYSEITAAAALPVIRALAPGAPPLRFSAPAPQGLPGGYPVRIEAGRVSLDLPPGADLDELVAFHWRLARLDGIERVEDDATVVFTDAAAAAIAGIDPVLAEPLAPQRAAERAARLIERLRV